MWTLKVAILVILVVLTLFVVGGTMYGHHNLFQPTDRIYYEPDAHYREFFLKGVYGRYFDNFPGQKTVLYCHGNNANLTSRKYIIDLCNRGGINLLLFDYQGYGKSSGSPYQYSIQPDAQTAYDYLIGTGVVPENIVVWGESLGGNPATFLAESNPISCLILLSTFSSMGETFSDYGWNYLHKVIEMSFDPADTVSRLKNVKCPVIVIHSTEDEMIPFKGAERLYSAINHKNKKLVQMSGPHGNPSIEPATLDQLIKYFKTGNLNWQ